MVLNAILLKNSIVGYTTIDSFNLWQERRDENKEAVSYRRYGDELYIGKF